MIQQQSIKNQVVVRSFNDIQIEPDTINHIFYSQQDNNLYVSRQKSTQVYHIIQNQNQQDPLQFQHIARLPWSKYVLKINQIIFLFCPFQLRVFYNGSWDLHPFTTQLLSINVKKVSPSLTFVYSFHQQQSIQYRLSSNQDDQDFSMNFMSKGKTPFHITKQNIVQGYGKKISIINKNSTFTVSDFKNDDYLVIGDSQGSLHIYDYKTLGHLKSFKRHLGPILTIKIDIQSDSIFYTGSDSKVVAVRRVNDDWVLSGQVRGQSHDIFSLQLINSTLVSGGLTTDLCCYPVHKSNEMLKSYTNKISYHSQNIAFSMKNYLLINKQTSFQLWKIRQSQNQLQYLVSYQMPAQKFIKDIKISKRLSDKTHLIIVSSQIDTVGWKFDQQNGLVKLFTIQNCYQFIQFIPGKNVFIGLRNSGDIQRVHCKTGKIDQIINSQISLPTDMKLMSDQKLIVASNLTNQIKVFDLKKKSLLSKLSLNKIYQVLCEKSETEFLIKYVEDKKLYACNFSKKLIEQSSIVQLPKQANTIRYGGVIIHQSQVTKNLKRYWYFASDNKIYLVNNLNSVNKKKSIRSIFTRRIGTIVKPKINKSYEIGVVHLNFKRMINNMEIKPLIAKKIV